MSALLSTEQNQHSEHQFIRLVPTALSLLFVFIFYAIYDDGHSKDIKKYVENVKFFSGYLFV